MVISRCVARATRMALAVCLLPFAVTHPQAVRAPRATTDTQRVVFVCEHGSVKSMIAANLFNRLAAQRGLAARAVSRGTQPDSAVPDLVRNGLRADGIDIGSPKPVPLRAVDARGARMLVAFDVPLPAAVSALAPVRRWDGTPSVMRDYSAGSSAIGTRVRQLVDEMARTKGSSRTP